MRKIMPRVFCAFTPRILAAHGYAATQAALWNLHLVMEIKDEVYVAYLLSNEEKYEHDRDRYNVRPELGDRMVHRHLNRPEFTFGRHTLRFKLKSRALDAPVLMRQAKFLRRILPAWHARERAFPLVVFRSRRSVRRARRFRFLCDVVSRSSGCPRKPPSYREVRYPRMELAARKRKQMGNGRYLHISPRMSGDFIRGSAK